MKQLLKRSLLAATRLIGYRESEQRIIRQSGEFWSDTDSSKFRAYSHWKGEDGIADAAWLALGKQHLDLFHRMIRLTEMRRPIDRIIEWGCGGGCNAVHFAREAGQFIGVDVSQATLEECRRAVSAAGLGNFLPVLVDVAAPESALEQITDACDLFLCTYVMELVPTPAYGRRIVDIAYKLVRPGGLAIIQIKYATTDAATQPRRWGYKLNAANMTTYAIDQFWEICQQAGFEPLAVTLQPKQTLIGDERYAYFTLSRGA
ncbi:MAG TPA: class I SAM-dependent methyltransferase [Tepidisphaeraceae bacterium]|nr:class I SAM-dependent methyltransferase [Tepidisphaeraceae bacterium]